MNRRGARAKAFDGSLSVGDLRAFIRLARGRGGKSIVNPSFTLEYALDLYEKTLGNRPDDEAPIVVRPSRGPSVRMMRTLDALLITNILRDTL